jgi:hypothetical protein
VVICIKVFAQKSQYTISLNGIEIEQKNTASLKHAIGLCETGQLCCGIETQTHDYEPNMINDMAGKCKVKCCCTCTSQPVLRASDCAFLMKSSKGQRCEQCQHVQRTNSKMIRKINEHDNTCIQPPAKCMREDYMLKQQIQKKLVIIKSENKSLNITIDRQKKLLSQFDSELIELEEGDADDIRHIFKDIEKDGTFIQKMSPESKFFWEQQSDAMTANSKGHTWHPR